MIDALSEIVGAAVEIEAGKRADFAQLAPLLGALAKLGITSAGQACAFLYRKRAVENFEILLEELRQGKVPVDYVVPPDHAAAVLLRVHRASLEGTARVNLRLMAQVIRGQLEQKNLVADRFLYFADILAGLRREEIVLLGAILNLDKSMPAVETKPVVYMWKGLSAKLLGTSLFPDEQTIETYCFSVVRFGLLSQGVRGKRLAFGATPVLPTSILRELAAFIDIESSVSAEPN